jgi:hypothetical protein
MVAADFKWAGCVMSNAIVLIVDGHVSLKDRQALEELREHRQRLREQLRLKQTGPFDCGQSIRLYDAEVAVMKTGLQKLGGSASA